jgi:hypothetical protein
LKRGLPTGVVLELPPGQAFAQASHLVLLRGSLSAAGPPLLPRSSPDGGSPERSPSMPGSPRGTGRTTDGTARTTDGLRRASIDSQRSGDGLLLGAMGSASLRRLSVGAAAGGGGEAEWEAGLAGERFLQTAAPWLFVPGAGR